MSLMGSDSAGPATARFEVLLLAMTVLVFKASVLRRPKMLDYLPPVFSIYIILSKTPMRVGIS